jgi:hypothetical protein
MSDEFKRRLHTAAGQLKAHKHEEEERAAALQEGKDASAARAAQTIKEWNSRITPCIKRLVQEAKQAEIPLTFVEGTAPMLYDGRHVGPGVPALPLITISVVQSGESAATRRQVLGSSKELAISVTSDGSINIQPKNCQMSGGSLDQRAFDEDKIGAFLADFIDEVVSKEIGPG